MSLSEEFLNIDTPENVAFNYEVAGFATRGLAAIVDSLIIIILQVLVISVIVGLYGVGLSDFEGSFDQPIIQWLIAILGLVSFLLLWGYYLFFELIWNGQSPGKRWLKLRVVRVNGMPITLTESLIRNVVRLIDFLPFYYGVGIVAIFVHPQTRRLGDLAAGTLVIRDQGEVTLDKVAPMSKPLTQSTLSPAAEMLALERLTAQDIRMLEICLERYDTNTFETSENILNALLTRMETPDTWMNHLSTKVRLRLILDGVNSLER